MASPSTISPRVRDLLDLPERVRKGDFVLKLNEGLTRPEETAGTFVATPPLVDAFDRALGLVGSALRDGKSQAAYLHGSFGSGKSHFMAVLSLLLEAHEAAWKKPELHALREKHGFVGKTKLLQLRFHMIGKESLESAVFRGYLEAMDERHPGEVLPGVFADEALFDDAAKFLDELGDETFFEPMNAKSGGQTGNKSGGKTGGRLGKFAESKRWTRERFEACRRSLVPSERAELFTALVETRFPSYRDQNQFVDIDDGLAELARHAKGLGYDGIVLFLDELILWLAHKASDSQWLHNEVQKMVKLVEAQAAHREVPIVSFIARQRNLADMVGEEYAGDEQARLAHSLEYWEGRFDKIVLEDRNLPAVVEKRVVKPKDDGARAQLDKAFESMKRGATGGSWETMLGGLDGAAFRQLYPFSPALVDALVALSNSLQRSRTAIRLLNELLVDHVEDLRVGEVVRVGDLFDVLAGGEDAADGVMRARFQSAKRLYKEDLLPVIQATNQTATPEKCQRLRPDAVVAIGCSNCPERSCRHDNRIIKTLLIAALVPGVDVLKNMTVSRLVQLNHGSLKTPIPGNEVATSAKRLRDWASQVGQLQIGEQSDPTVSLRLEGVSVGPILQSARDKDSHGARQLALRNMLFEAMGLESPNDSKTEKALTWRGTNRRGLVRFANVRRLTSSTLECATEDDFQVIVDYPFDDSGHGPSDDQDVLEAFMAQGKGTWTLVWLPSFFSQEVNELLGEVVVLEHILSSTETKKRYLGSLGVEDRARAELDLESLKAQKRNRLRQSIEQAYGMRADRAEDLDSGRLVDKPLVVLKPGATVQMSLAPNLGEALDSFLPQLLEQRYPRHPELEGSFSARRMEVLLDAFGRVVDAPEKRIAADRDLVKSVRTSLAALGLVRVTEGAVLLMEDKVLQEIERRRAQEGEEHPTVEEVRAWIDGTGRMGLPLEILDLVVRCYARWSARTMVVGGRVYTASAKGVLPSDAVLEKPRLPGEAAWNAALGLVSVVFGETFAGKGLHGENLVRLAERLRERRERALGPVEALPGALLERLRGMGVDAEASGGSDAPPRLVTAQSARALLHALDTDDAVALVEALAAFQPATSSKALRDHLTSAAAVLKVLQDNLVFGVFESLGARADDVPGAAELLDDVRRCLRQDELNEHAATTLRNLAERAQLLTAPTGPAKPGGGAKKPGTRVVASRTLDASGRAAALAALDEAVAELRAAIESGEDVVLHGKLEVLVRSDDDGGHG
ncbi:MAG: hypothetical protein H6726_22920 [Sandaracinaceae bacterium]|nr:hypothetical protein [Sandaracinaceae bacterium]